MKSRIIAVLIIIILALNLVSCFVTSRDIHVDISCNEFAENPTGIRNDFEMEIGDKLYVVLCSNPSTGFEWSYKMSDDSVIKEEGHDFEEPDSNLPGAAGKETWTFETVDKGTTMIDMEYSQPWEGGIKQEWMYRITVTVK